VAVSVPPKFRYIGCCRIVDGMNCAFGHSDANSKPVRVFAMDCERSDPYPAGIAIVLEQDRVIARDLAAGHGVRIEIVPIAFCRRRNDRLVRFPRRALQDRWRSWFWNGAQRFSLSSGLYVPTMKSCRKPPVVFKRGTGYPLKHHMPPPRARVGNTGPIREKQRLRERASKRTRAAETIMVRPAQRYSEYRYTTLPRLAHVRLGTFRT